MNDLISRSALLEAFGEEPMVWFDHDDAQTQERNDWRYYTELVEAAPAVDAVEVVRCKDCKHCSQNTPDGYHWCAEHERGLLEDDDFCSHGEKAV